MKTSNSGRARKAIQLVLAAGMAVGASQQALAGNIFLSIPGIPGESTDDKHKDQIDIESYSQSVEGRDCQLSFSKRVDKASPLLAEAASTRKTIPSATLVVRRLNYKDQSDEYIKLTMSSVTVVSSDMCDKRRVRAGEHHRQHALHPDRPHAAGARRQAPARSQQDHHVRRRRGGRQVAARKSARQREGPVEGPALFISGSRARRRLTPPAGSPR